MRHPHPCFALLLTTLRTTLLTTLLTLLLTLLLTTAALGCGEDYPDSMMFGVPDVGGGDGGVEAGVGDPNAGGGGRGQTGGSGQIGLPFAGSGAGAGGSSALPPLQLTCPNCAGLCVFGICVADLAAGGMGGLFGGGMGAQPLPPECGDDEVSAGETCDPPSSCPDECDDDDSCTVDDSTGSADDCDFACTHDEITACEDDDGCCPDDCDENDDSDCDPVCGNDAIETGETCDPPGSCADCDDEDSCTTDSETGSADMCTLLCGHAAITACGADEGCCPGSCGPTTDSDCPGCGNGRVEAGLGETCDPPGSCGSCADSNACTVDTTTGSADQCNLACTHDEITACNSGDQCCADGCGPVADHDCPGCGNANVEPALGETCDPPESCLCDDHNPCTTNVRGGFPASCNVVCSYIPISECSNTGDSCCPGGCDFNTDADCLP